MHDEQCVDFVPGEGFVGDGTFTITARVGTLTGTFTSVGCGCDGPFTFPLVVTGGTGAYHGASGTIEIDGNLTFGAFPTFSETGTFVANVTR